MADRRKVFLDSIAMSSNEKETFGRRVVMDGMTELSQRTSSFGSAGKLLRFSHFEKIVLNNLTVSFGSSKIIS